MNARYYSAALLALCLGLPLSARAYQIRYSRTGSVIRWDRAEFPIHYYIDSNPSMPSGAVEGVIRAFQSWENVGPARLSFAYRGLIKSPAVANDGRNCIIWVEDGWRHGAQTIAHATTWYFLEDGRIVDCDIEVNARDYDWSTAPSAETLDIQNVIAHEIGHLLGLDDIFNSLDGTMFGFILRGETTKRSLDIDEVRGSSFLYPLSASFEAVEAAYIDREGESLSPILPRRDTPEEANIILISSCDWDRNGIGRELAAVSYEEENGFTFHVYRLPDPEKGEEEISIAAKDEWMIAAGVNARCMAAVDADGDGSRDEIVILKDTAEGEPVINIYKFSSAMEAPSLLCRVPIGTSDSATHMAGVNGDEICLLRKVEGRRYNLSLHRLDIPREKLSLKEDYGELPVAPDEEVLSIFSLEKDAGKAAVLGILAADAKGRARIDFMEPEPGGELSCSLSIQLPGSSPVLATSIDSNGDGLLNEIVLITE